MDDEEWKQLLLALRHLAQCRDSTERACLSSGEPCSRAPETQGSDRHVRSRRARLFPKARKVFAVSLSAFLFFQHHSADRTFTRFVGLDLRMHRACVNRRASFYLVRFFFISSDFCFIASEVFFISSEVFFISLARAFFSC